MDVDDVSISLDGLIWRQPPKETELEAALDSWWLLPKCEAYGLSKAGLLRALRELHTSSVSDFAESAHQAVTSPEAMKVIEQHASERKIEDVALVAMEGKVKHELSLKEKTGELIALGIALLTYVSSLGSPQSETATFGMGHERRELVFFWCKDPSKRHLYYANLVSRNVFELAKDIVLDLIHTCREIFNLTPPEFLGSLTKRAGTKNISLSSSDDYLGAVTAALIMGRPDLIASIHDSLGETFAKERAEPSDADSDTSKALLNKTLGAILGAQYMDGSTVNLIEQLFDKMHIIFDPTILHEFITLPSPLQKEVVHIIYAEIYREFGKGTPEQFNEALNLVINRTVQSYSWEGVDKHGALFSGLSSEEIGQLKRYAENVFARAKLTEPQKRVLKLELTLDWYDQNWNEKEKAEWLRMKQGSYRQHLFQARLKANSVHQKPKELNGYQRLLRAVFGDRP